MQHCNEHTNLMDTVRDIHGDVKVLVSEFKAMNGSLRDTKAEIKEHKQESDPYRRKIDVVWSSLHAIKWAIFLLFGTGVFWKAFEWWTK